MSRLNLPYIQIAGMRTFAEAEMMASLGVEYIGFPLALHFHEEDLPASDVRIFCAALCQRIKPVLITYLSEHNEIAELAEYIGAGAVQLHGELPLLEVIRLRERRPELAIIKSLVVENDNFEDLAIIAKQFGPYADAFITDTYDPETGARGATGKTHDWEVSKKLVELAPKPVILAGGLNSKNVREAIATVHPAGVDAHTGVEDATGIKTPELVSEFITRAREGFRMAGV
ncbi:MAG: phosphoribosylanthranilate isomerase [Candidatus Kapaibacterium sp.]